MESLCGIVTNYSKNLNFLTIKAKMSGKVDSSQLLDELRPEAPRSGGGVPLLV
jgi:hypothetical protein